MNNERSGTREREEIITANPILDFVASRGHELRRAGQNFVSNDCPVTQHKRGHRPVMICPETQSWMCHEFKRGGSVIDWLMIEKNVAAVDAMRMLAGGNDGSAEIVATYDYTDVAAERESAGRFVVHADDMLAACLEL